MGKNIKEELITTEEKEWVVSDAAYPKRKRCKGCGHRRPLTRNNKSSMRVCHYLLDTGKVRGCPPEECTHYTTEKCHELGKWQTLEELQNEIQSV